MKAYKGFNKDMTCRGFQYEVGKEYETDKADLCTCGFHACLYPQDCFGYYPPAISRYCLVEIDDVDKKSSDDTKICGKKIKIIKELTIEEMATASVEYVLDRIEENKIGGDWSSLNGGDWSSLNGGNRSSLNGGYGSSLKGGYGSSLKGGDWSSLNGGNRSSLKGGYGSSLKGGEFSVVYGGENSKVKGGLHSVLAVQLWKNNNFIKIVFAEVDGEKIKADTWYKLENGEFVEVNENE